MWNFGVCLRRALKAHHVTPALYCLRSLMVALKLIATMAGVLLLVSVAIGVPILLIPLVDSAQNAPISPPAASAFRAAFVWAIEVFILLLVALLFLATFRSFLRVKEVFGATPQVRLIALGLTAIVTPNSVYQVVYAPIWFIAEILRKITPKPSRLPESSRLAEHLSIDDVVRRIEVDLYSLAVELGSIIKDLADWVRVSDLVFAFALWAFLGHLLSVASETHGHGQPTRLTTFLRSLSSLQRRWLVLSALLLVSGYLSIAAMVSIPWLQQRIAVAPISKEQLQSSLERRIMQPADFDKAFPMDLSLTVDGIDSLEKVIEEVLTEIDKAKPDVSVPRYLLSYSPSQLMPGVKEIVATRGRAWDDLRSQAHQQERDSLNNSLKYFETETVSPMSIQERAVYIERLDQWLAGRLDRIYGSLRDCKVATLELKFQMQNAVQKQITELRRLLDWLRSFQTKRQTVTTATVEAWPMFGGPESYPSEILSTQRCEGAFLDEVTRPTPPDPGLGLGPFRWISSWLVSTKSLALVLITGMLGFGLLGATISSFLRPDVKFMSAEPVPGELGGVVIRGLSAAVIVFLAVKGGLAAYAVGETEPNAYVLFFTCLLGAAFSERVWKWAQKKLEDQLIADASAKEKMNAEKKNAEKKGTGENELEKKILEKNDSNQ